MMVKERFDGLGDAFAELHRRALPSNLYFQDIDQWAGSVVVGDNTENSLYLEYVPDIQKDLNHRIRDFIVLGFFDRKKSKAAVTASHKVQEALYLHLCRTLSDSQVVQCRFFYVVGVEAPFSLIEVNILSGEYCELGKVDESTMFALWHKCGLIQSHEDAREIMRRRSNG